MSKKAGPSFKVFVATTAPIVENLTLNVAYDFAGRRVSLAVHCRPSAAQVSQSVWTGETPVPEEEQVFLAAMTGLDPVALHLSAVVQHTADGAPLTHNYHGPLVFSKNLNLFVFFGSWVHQATEEGVGRSNHNVHSNFLRALNYLIQSISSSKNLNQDEVLGDLSEYLGTLVAEKSVPLTSQALTDLAELISERCPHSGPGIWNFLSPLAVTDLTTEIDAAPRQFLLEEIEKRADAFKEYIRRQFVGRQRISLTFLEICHRLLRLLNKKVRDKQPDHKNRMVQLIMEALTPARPEPFESSLVSSFADQLLLSLFNDRIRLEGNGHSLLSSLTQGTRIYDLFFANDLESFFRRFQDYAASSILEKNDCEKVLASYKSQLQTPDTRRRLGTPVGLLESIDFLTKLPLHLRTIFSNNLVQYRTHLRAVVQACATRQPMDFGLIYDFLESISGNPELHNPLVDICYELTDIQKQAPIFLQLLRQAIQRPNTLKFVSQAFAIILDLTEAPLPVPLEEVHAIVKHAIDRPAFLSVMFTHFQITMKDVLYNPKSAFRSLRGHEVVLDAVEFLIHSATTGPNPGYDGSQELALNRLEMWAHNTAERDVPVTQLLRDQHFMGRLYNNIPREDFLETVFVKRSRIATKWYFKQFLDPAMFSRSDRLTSNAELFQATFDGLAKHSISVDRFTDYTAAPGTFRLQAVMEAILRPEPRTNLRFSDVFEGKKSLNEQIFKAKGDKFSDLDDPEVDFADQIQESERMITVFEEEEALNLAQESSVFPGADQPGARNRDFAGFGKPNERELDNRLFGKDRVLQARENVNRLLQLLEKFGGESPDFAATRAYLVALADPHSNRPVREFLDDRVFNQLWNRHSKLCILLTNFRYVLAIHMPVVDASKQTTAERLGLLQQTYEKLEQRMDSFKRHFPTETPASLKALFGPDNQQSVLDSIFTFFKEELPHENLIRKAIHFVLERGVIQTYFNTFRVFHSSLHFHFESPDERLALISRLESISDTHPLSDLAELIPRMERELNFLVDIKTLCVSLADYKDLARALEFIEESKDQYEFMKEFTTEVEGFDITWQDIDDLELIADFYQKWVKNDIPFVSLKEVDGRLKALTRIPEFRDIPNKMRHNFKLHPNLVEYKTQIKEDANTRLKWIGRLMTDSTISLTLEGTPTVQTEVMGPSGLQRNTKTFAEFAEIRNLIKMKSMVLGEEDKTSNDANKVLVARFLNLFGCVESIKKSWETLSVMGYMASSQEVLSFKVRAGDIHEAADLDRLMAAKAGAFVESLQTAYESSYLGTFLYGRLIETFHSIFSRERPQTTDFFYLKYLGLPKETNLNHVYQTQLAQAQGVNPAAFLVAFVDRELRRFSSFNHTQRLTGETTLTTQKILLCSTKDGNLFRKILTINLIAAKRFPAHYNVLFCKPTTPFSEIISFLHRIYACPFNEAFVMVQPDLFSYETQQEVIRLIARLSGKTKRQASFFILSSDRECLLLQQLTESKLIKTFVVNEDMYQTQFGAAISLINQDVCFVSSPKVLSGKTNFIREQARVLPRPHNFKVLTVSGGLNLAGMIRLLSGIFQIPLLFLHVEIEQIVPDRLSELDEFLMGIIFFKLARFGSQFAVPGDDVKLYIEFDSSSIQNAFRDLLITKLGIRTVTQIENVAEISPTLAPSLALVRFVTEQPATPLAANNLRSGQTSFGVEDIRFWTDYVLNKFLKHELEYVRPRSSMFEKIVTFAISLMLPDSLPQQKDQPVVFKGILGMAEALSRTAIHRIKESQDRATAIMIADSARKQQEGGALSRRGSLEVEAHALALGRQLSMSPWNRSDTYLFLWLKRDYILACKDPSLVPTELINFVSGKAKVGIESHIDFMKELLKLNLNPVDKSICPLCKTLFVSNQSTCNRCPASTAPASQAPESRRPIASVRPRREEAANKLIKKSEDAGRKYIKMIEDIYTVTPDNYMKILSIFIRAKSGLPVVVMGETGCGKTSLIRFLTTYILDDQVEIFNVHAGTTEADISARMEALFLRCRQDPNKHNWFVFDEFNTTPACGLIKSIMLTRFSGATCFPPNAIFVATCNPYDLKNENTMGEEAVGLKRREMRAEASQYRLQYMVQPIPESLLFYTFNFGHLKPEDEQKYISIWLHPQLSAELTKAVSKLICDIHAAIKEHFGASSVSLRDMKRLLKVLSFFTTRYFKEKGEVLNSKIKPLVLSLLLCYYVRLSLPEKRAQIASMIETTLKLSPGEAVRIFQAEQQFLMTQLQPERGVVTNQALAENIFCLFVCCLNKVPLLICGKPGSSKSLSVQLLFSRMKGPKSSNPFFSVFEELVMIPYQGSESSTSKNVEKVFDKAEAACKEAGPGSGNGGKIAVVVFDEIGLAEISKNNPLKVLHFKLEIENIKVGFVGISNWQLDASKMNRVLCLSRRDPDVNELVLTSQTIGASIVGNFQDFLAPKFQQLALLYFRLKERSADDEKRAIYGLRDFYALVKNVANSFARFVGTTEIGKSVDYLPHLYQCVIESILRNFNLDETCWREMWTDFCQMNPADQPVWSAVREPSLEALLNQNLGEVGARQVMVITERPEVHSRVYQIMERSELDGLEGHRRFRVMVGSKFDGDVSSEAYLVRSINEVILYMEQPVVLIIHQFNGIFTSLYDLFNQNFRRHGSQNYCRIIQGAFGKSSYRVHDLFKVIVFMTPEEVAAADIPLINRFEKYFLDGVHSFFQENSAPKRLMKDLLGELFPEDNPEVRREEIRKCIGNFSENSFYEWTCRIEDQARAQGFSLADPQVVRDLVDQTIFQVANLRLSARVHKHLKSRNTTDFLDRLIRSKEATFRDVIQSAEVRGNLTFDITYTFTSPHLALANHLGNFTLREVVLETFKEERELRSVFQEFFLHKTLNHLIIKINGRSEAEHLYSVQHLLDSASEDTAAVPKHVHLVICYRLNSLHESPNFFVGRHWTTAFVDNLLQAPPEAVREILKSPDLLTSLDRIRSLSIETFDSLIDRVFEEINFHRHDDAVLDRVNTYYAGFSQKYGPDLVNALADFIFRLCRDDPELTGTLTVFDLLAQQSELRSADFAESVQVSVQSVFQRKLADLIRWIEAQMMINPLLEATEKRQPQMIDFWVQLVLRKFTDERTEDPRQAVPLFHRLSFPLALKESNALAAFHQRLKGGVHSDGWPEESLAQTLFEQFQKEDIFWADPKIGASQWSEEWLTLLFADLVYLQLFSQNEFGISSQDIQFLCSELFVGRTRSLLSLFVAQPYLVSNCLLLLHIFRRILGTEASTLFRNTHRQLDHSLPTPPYFKAILDQLIRSLVSREFLVAHENAFFMEHYRLLRLVRVVEQASKERFEGAPQLFFWLELIRLAHDTPEPLVVLRESLQSLGFEYLRVFDDFSFGQQLFEAVGRAISGLSTEAQLNFRDLICDFEADYYLRLIQTNAEPAVLLPAFAQVFSQIEEDSTFQLHSNQLLVKFLDLSKIRQGFLAFCNQGQPLQASANPFLRWILDNLPRFPRRLPYLLMNHLTAIHEWDRPYFELINLTPQLTDQMFRAYLSLTPTSPLTLQTVFDLSLLRMTANLYAAQIQTPVLDPRLKPFAAALSASKSPDPRVKALHIYVIKSLGLEANLQTVTLFDKTIQSYLAGEKFQIPNAECVATDEPLFLQLSKIFESSSLPIPRRLEDMFSLLSRHNTPKATWAFYLILINKTQTSLQWIQNFGEEVLRTLDRLLSPATALFGDLGVAFLRAIAGNFDPSSPFRVSQNLKEATVRQNINTLAAFAFWLSQINAHSYFSSVLFGKAVDGTTVTQRLFRSFLPGAILPGREDLGYMMVILRGNNNTVYRCSKTCNFFYEFANCQQANSQEGFVPKCMLCGSPLGAKTLHGQLYGEQVRLTRDQAVREIQGYMMDYFHGAYRQGVTDASRTIKDANDYNLNVDVKTTAFLHFLTNSLLSGLQAIGVCQKELEAVFEKERPALKLQQRQKEVFDFFRGTIRSADVHVLLNAMVDSLFQGPLGSDQETTFGHYLELEKELERTMARSTLMRAREIVLDYKAKVQTATAFSKQSLSICPIVEEVMSDAATFADFPLLNHLRLAPTKAHLYQFFDRFDSNFADFHRRFPLTDFFRKNLNDLANLRLVLLFKHFYDPFCQRFDGRIGRAEAEVKTIGDFLETEPSLLRPFLTFQTAWNETVDRVSTVDYECQVIHLKKIQSSESLVRLLPTLSRDNASADIFIGLNAFIVFQNKMIDTLISALTKTPVVASRALFNWKHVSPNTIFVFNRDDFEAFLNSDALKANCDYGNLGAYDFNFPKFEQFLVSRIFELAAFVFPLVPEFRYALESADFQEHLITIRGSGFQQPFTQEEEARWRERLDPKNHPQRSGYLNDIWQLLALTVLPRAVHLTFENTGKTLQAFLEGSVSTNLFRENPSLAPLADLPVGHIYSFVLLFELVYYKSMFEDTDRPATRLETSEAAPGWSRLAASLSEDIGSCDLYSRYGTLIVDALSRVVLRASFNNASLLSPLSYFLTDSEIVWPVGFRIEKIEDLQMNPEIQLGHAYLVLCRLKQERNTALKIKKFVDPRGLANIDLEDRQTEGGVTFHR